MPGFCIFVFFSLTKKIIIDNEKQEQEKKRKKEQKILFYAIYFSNLDEKKIIFNQGKP